jgi:hypothetical protein
MLKHRFLTFLGSTAIVDISLEDLGKIVKFAGGIRNPLDPDTRTVQIHLPNSSEIKPGPSKYGLSIGRKCWNSEV